MPPSLHLKNVESFLDTLNVQLIYWKEYLVLFSPLVLRVPLMLIFEPLPTFFSGHFSASIPSAMK